MLFAPTRPDCDDEDPAVHPGADETPYNGIDEDCSGADLTDQDGDGFDGGALGPDCDDTDPNVHPGAQELTDGLDNNCDGHIPELEAPKCSGAWVGGRCLDDGCGGCGEGDAAALLPLLMVWRRRRHGGRVPGLGAPIGDVRATALDASVGGQSNHPLGAGPDTPGSNPDERPPLATLSDVPILAPASR